jgi:ADP-heptose:LPS heptosyltransferase
MATRGAPSEPSTWRRGLILGHNHIGDVVYRTCSLRPLAEAYPECRWSYLTARSSGSLLEGNPALAEVLPWNSGENSWELESGKFAELRRRKFDVVLCTNTLRHYPDLALSVALGAPNRVAYSYKGLSGLITRPAPIHFPSQYPAYFRGMVADLACRAPDWPLRPHIFPSDTDRAFAQEAFDNLGLVRGRRVVACSFTTRQRSGNWPASHMLGALERARAQTEFELVLCGARSDADQLSAAARLLSFPAHVLAGGLGLRAYAAFLALCDVLFTLDSGPRHIGNAMGIPVLFARNLSHSMIEAGKYCDTEIDLAPSMEYLSDAEAKSVVAGIPVESTATRLLETLAAMGRA